MSCYRPRDVYSSVSVSVIAIIGAIMLAGIVVNYASILVDYTNLLRREHGMGLREAIEEDPDAVIALFVEDAGGIASTLAEAAPTPLLGRGPTSTEPISWLILTTGIGQGRPLRSKTFAASCDAIGTLRRLERTRCRRRVAATGATDCFR